MIPNPNANKPTDCYFIKSIRESLTGMKCSSTDAPKPYRTLSSGCIDCPLALAVDNECGFMVTELEYRALSSLDIAFCNGSHERVLK